MTAILDLIEYIISAFFTAYDSLIDLIINIPKYLAEALEATGGVFSLFSAFYANIPDKVWLGILLSALGIFLMRFLYGNNSNNKGGS